MCFKAPKAPPKTAQEIALEQEAQAAREQRKRDLSILATREKQKRYEDAVARSRGQWGARSLISGPKGGAGFMFGGGRNGLPLIVSSGGSGGSASSYTGGASSSGSSSSYTGYTGGSSSYSGGSLISYDSGGGMSASSMIARSSNEQMV